MIPRKLTLTGAIGIQAGLNRETLDIDLDIIPDDALVVAVRGDNGSGKSTLLNLGLTPWREPPQLPGSVYDHFGPEGVRELEWTHEGREFRSRIEIKQTDKTRTQRAYLHERSGLGWQPVELQDRTVSDGKTSTYDACLEHILGPRDIYYLSAFRAQNAATLAERDDPKRLMRKLLALDEPEQLAEQSRDVARILRRHYDELRHRIERYDEHEERIAFFHAEIRSIDEEQPQRMQAQVSAQETVARCKAELGRIMDGELEQARLVEQRAEAAARLVGAERDADANLQRLNAQLAGIRQRRSMAIREHERINRQHAADRGKLELRREVSVRLLEQRAEIEAASTECETLARRIEKSERTESELSERIFEFEKLIDRIGALEREEHHLRDIAKTMAVRCEELKRQADFVTEVPCGGVAPYDTCPALREALRARDQIEPMKQARDERLGKLNDLKNDLVALRYETQDLPDAKNQREYAGKLLQHLRDDLKNARRLADRAAEIAQAEESLREARTDLDELGERIAEQVRTYAEAIAAIDDEIKNIETEMEQTAFEDRRRINAARAELEALPEPDDDTILKHARQALTNAESELHAAHTVLQRATADKVARETEIVTLRRELDESAAQRQRSERLALEIAEWNLLVAGLRGVVDLVIEDAGPGIAAIANRLLTEAYGPRFSVRIVTQRRQRNERLVECFDVSVVDAETGIESSMLHKSGGESVWLDKALTDAVGLHHQEVAGVNYECLFADEVEDGLTEERKRAFYRMDRAALELGGYKRKFAISHNPEAWALADYVIDLGAYRRSE